MQKDEKKKKKKNIYAAENFNKTNMRFKYLEIKTEISQQQVLNTITGDKHLYFSVNLTQIINHRPQYVTIHYLRDVKWVKRTEDGPVNGE